MRLVGIELFLVCFVLFSREIYFEQSHDQDLLVKVLVSSLFEDFHLSINAAIDFDR